MVRQDADVVVIGGGASGMMAAFAAAEAGADVVLLEKNEKLGKKIYITGKGRCNFTNACETEDFFGNVPCNASFLYSSIYAFDPHMTIEWFQEHGLRAKVERGSRAFPESDHASDVTKTLREAMKSAGVTVRMNAEAAEIGLPDRALGPGPADCPDEAGGPEGHCGGSRRGFTVKLKSGEVIRAGAVVIATGGLSYPSTGSTGDGYRFARAAGHKVNPCFPSLVPLLCGEKDIFGMQGLSLKNVDLKILDGKRKVWNGFGEMMFTHFGVTGPLILTASSDLQNLLGTHRSGKNMQSTGKTEGNRAGDSMFLNAEIDLKPALSEEKLDARILRELNQNPNKEIRNVIGAVYPSKMVPVILRRSGIDPEKPVHDITKAERLCLAGNTKHFRFTITGTGGFNEAVITHGGVSVREIDPATMESKKAKGLFFAGEVLDVDAHTGGFNLQIAWSTGRAAGCGAAEYAAREQTS